MGRWCVRVWIPVDTEDDEIYSSYDEASKVEQSLTLMQPENIYQVIDLDLEEKEVGDDEIVW